MSLFVIFSFYSCEKEVNNSVGVYKSKIWVTGLVQTNDTVKIFLGTTSGLNSGDMAEYKSNATVKLYVNTTDVPIDLQYKAVSATVKKGYYYYPRLSEAKSGDSLYFEAWIEGEDFSKVSAGTVIPYTVKIKDIEANSVLDINSKFVNVDLHLDTTLLYDGDKYFELRIQNLEYKDTVPNSPVGVSTITLLNDLNLSSGMLWNEQLHSILIDFDKVQDDNILKLGLRIRDGFVRNELKFELRTINKGYYDYFRALDNSSVVKSNISNGSGIFAGYAKHVKTVTIK